MAAAGNQIVLTVRRTWHALFCLANHEFSGQKWQEKLFEGMRFYVACFGNMALAWFMSRERATEEASREMAKPMSKVGRTGDVLCFRRGRRCGVDRIRDLVHDT